MLFSRCRLAAVASLCGLVVLLLSACNPGTQSDPPGQNSGSPQYAQGAFNLDDPHAVSGTVGQALTVYNIYTTISTSITVNSATATRASQNKNASTQILTPDEQFLVVNLTIDNLSKGDTKTCPLNVCTEYVSPLSNFRLIDPSGRNWPTSTGAEENCAPLSDNCNSRRWIAEATNGIPAGGSFQASLNFVIPINVHTFTLNYAAYRFNDTATDTSAGGTDSSSTSSGGATPAVKVANTPAATSTPAPTAAPTQAVNQPTLARITISV